MVIISWGIVLYHFLLSLELLAHGISRFFSKFLKRDVNSYSDVRFIAVAVVTAVLALATTVSQLLFCDSKNTERWSPSNFLLYALNDWFSLNNIQRVNFGIILKSTKV